MKKTIKILIIVTLTTALSYGTYQTANFIGGKYFFDKLFYKKSALYGYQPQGLNLLSYKNSPLIESRISDIRLITQAGSNQKILGASTEDHFKIAIIGDSFVYGTGVKQDARYSKQLEIMLNQVKPTQIYSLALPGDNIVENYAKFKLAQKQLSPDLYIIGIANNDLLINDPIYPSQDEIYQKIRQDCTQPEFRYNWPNQKININQLITDAYFPSFDDKYANICYLKEIINDMVDENVLFFNFYRVNQTENLSDFEIKDIELMKKYTNIIKIAGGNIFQLHDSKKIGHYKPVSPMEGHPSAQTHNWFASALSKKIIEDVWK